MEPSECVGLARYVSSECPNLELSGLMTIGMLDYSSTPQNFEVKVEAVSIHAFAHAYFPIVLFSLCLVPHPDSGNKRSR